MLTISENEINSQADKIIEKKLMKILGEIFNGTRIIDGISIRINEVFGDDYEIYSEDIEQGFKEPCFFILPLNQKNQLN